MFVATHEPDASPGCEGRRHPTLPGVSWLCFPTAAVVVVGIARTRVSGPPDAAAGDVLRARVVRSATSSHSGERTSRGLRGRVTRVSLSGGRE